MIFETTITRDDQFDVQHELAVEVEVEVDDGWAACWDDDALVVADDGQTPDQMPCPNCNERSRAAVGVEDCPQCSGMGWLPRRIALTRFELEGIQAELDQREREKDQALREAAGR